ncbi:PREDICTED: UPF0728 protein C10orf53 homolog [Nestor notabilis]|uniref:UPF0728 protein C10orf53 homolog n=1 Tax=Nestor notabilis TaxID=176057 RepID=UPI0005239B8F|nr:PREDICTED: UPF0728 protein C10orf53 homolog [Nestor notabilis]
MDKDRPGLNLEKLVAVLQANGHQLILEEIPYWNTAELVVNGKTVFHCNINDLEFGKYRVSFIAVSC